MELNRNPLTFREKIYLTIIFIMLIGFFAQNLMLEKTISGYSKAYAEMKYLFVECERGVIVKPNWNTVNLSQFTNDLPMRID